MRYLSVSVAVAVGCMLLPGTAFGQAGTRPDPDSPAGVEYQLPLDQARTNAAGGDKQNGDGKGDARVRAPLFGAGIAARGGGDGPGEGARSGAGGAADGSGDAAGGSGGDNPSGGASGSADGASGKSSSGDPEVSQSGVVTSDSDDSSGTLRIAGIALGVLLLGGLLGFALRRGLGQPGT